MRLIIFLVLAVFIVLVYFRLRSNSHSQSASSVDEDSSKILKNDDQNASANEFVFISKGKLFHRTSNQEIEQINSPYVQEMIDRMARRKQVHGWKQDTALNTSFTGRSMDSEGDQVDLQVVAAEFIGGDKLIYFMKDNNVGGLFEYDIKTQSERRLMHKQNLSFENLVTNSEIGKTLCSQHESNGIANIVVLGDEGATCQQLTEGDTVDTAPSWIPGNEKQIVYQSSGLARSEDGYVIAHGPAAIKLLDIESQNVSAVLEDTQTDYLQPKVDSKGNLLFIRRPYEIQTYHAGNAFLDFVLFPFRLMRAVFYYLNFFSLMYSRKPLTTASGPKVNADIKEMLIKGKRVDAEKALQKESRVNGVQSLVPRSWQLVRRSQSGQEVVLATNVASFDLTDDDEILFSNGYAVFKLNADGRPAVLLKNKLIADIIAA